MSPSDRDAAGPLALARAHRRVLWLALALVALLGVANSVISPLFEPPDELQHYQYVHHLVAERALPVQASDGPRSQAHQPPLYYALGALLVAPLDDPATPPVSNPFWGYEAGQPGNDNKRQWLPREQDAWPWRGTARAVHLLRLGSVAMLLGATWAMAQVGRAVWPRHPLRVAAMLGVGALNPMYLYIGGAVTNDALMALWGALLLYLALRARQRHWPWPLTLGIGALWGLALLTKISALALAPIWALALVSSARCLRSRRLLLTRGVAVGALALALCAPWYLRNVALYGEPFGMAINLAVWGARSPQQLGLARLWADARFAFTNFWGRFGYGQVPMPAWFYGLYAALTTLAGLGGLAWLGRGGWRRLSPERRDLWAMLLAGAAGLVLAMVYYLLRSTTGGNGRYLFPAMPAIAALLVAGWGGLIDPAPRSRPSGASGWRYAALTALLAAVAIYTSGRLAHIYAPPPRIALAALAGAQRVEVVYPGLGTLLGYAVPPAGASAGQPLPVTLYWRADADVAADHRLFVQLVAADGARVAGRDTHPGLGNYPTGLWRHGELLADTIPVPLPPEADALAPTGLRLDVGLWDAAGQHLLRTADGQTTVALGRVRLGVREPPPQAGVAAYTLGGLVELQPAPPLPPRAAPGQALTVTLTWRALAAPAGDYAVLLHLLNDADALVAAYDGPPQGGAYPTALWQPGDVVVDEHTLVLPAALPPGRYRLVTGWYRADTLERLPVMAAGQPVEAGLISLGAFAVTP